MNEAEPFNMNEMTVAEIDLTVAEIDLVFGLHRGGYSYSTHL